MMKKYFVLSVFIAWLFTLSSLRSYACSCLKPEISQAFSEARAVFIGEVSEIIEPRTNNPKAPLTARLYSIKFKVERSWKGVASQEIIILSDQGRAGCFSWGPFVIGEKYLVYAEKRTPAGVPIKSLAVLFSCNRTILSSNASEDIEQLETLIGKNHLKSFPNYWMQQSSSLTSFENLLPALLDWSRSSEPLSPSKAFVIFRI
jgi:hypothetical protein